MRYRDLPTVEATQRVRCDVPTAWALVTDISLPVHCSTELQGVDWLDGATAVEVGARFHGRSKHEAFGEWSTVCEVVEIEDQRRWVYNVVGPEGTSATWAFEVEPTSDGVLVRQGGRRGPGPSALPRAVVGVPGRGPGPVRADAGDRGDTGQGGQDRLEPAGRMAEEHAGQPGVGAVAGRGLTVYVSRIAESSRRAAPTRRAAGPLRVSSAHSGSAGGPMCPQPRGQSLIASARSEKATTTSSGLMWASPNERIPGVSTTQPS